MKNSAPLAVAALSLLFAAAGATAAPMLAIDFNDRQPTLNPDTQPGFSPFILTNTTTISASVTTPSSATIGAYTVTLAPFDDGLDENTVTAGVQNGVGALDDRPRATPVNSGSLTYAQLYADVIFAGTTVGPTGGMNLTITGGSLLPNTQYSVSLYSFDSGSTTAPEPRTANWLDGNNADTLVTSTSFNGGTLPTTDSQYRFTGLAMTDASGAILLKGRNTTPNSANGATNIGVFLNGLELNAVPEPASLLAACGLALPLLRRRRA